jgi:tetratricopeptide (TPR) repeat protein
MSQDGAGSAAVRALFLGGVSGEGCYDAGDLEGAALHFEAALQEAWKDTGNLEPAGWWSERLARCALLQGRLNAAMERALESIKIRQVLAAEQDRYDARWRLAGALLVLGDAFEEQGGYEPARGHYQEALALAESRDEVMAAYGSEQAQEHRRKVAALRGSALLLRLGDGAFREGEDGEALERWRAAWRLLQGFEEDTGARLVRMQVQARVAGVKPRDEAIFGGAPLLELCLMEAHHALSWQLPLDDRIDLARYLDRLAALAERRGIGAPWLRASALRLLSPLMQGPLCPSLSAILRRGG